MPQKMDAALASHTALVQRGVIDVLPGIYRAEHLLHRVGKERCATKGRHPSFKAFLCHSPHGKRRRTTISAGLAGPFEHKDYGALSPCDGTQASRGALTFGSDQQRLHRTVSAHTGLTLANPPPSGLTWRRSVHRCRAAARLSATN